jgi:hypothetical protein
MPSIAGGMDIHRKQVTFDYLDVVTGEVKCGQIAPADRGHLRAWLQRFAGVSGVAFAVEARTGWRYVTGELAAAGAGAHLAEPAEAAAAGTQEPGQDRQGNRERYPEHYTLGPASPALLAFHRARLPSDGLELLLSPLTLWVLESQLQSLSAKRAGSPGRTAANYMSG